MAGTDDLLNGLWLAIDRAAVVERELREASEELAAWREVAAAAVRALDQEVARRREEDAVRTIA